MFRLAALVLGAILFTGCATGSRAYMDSPLSNHSEPASVWNRPQEVGFDWGEEISGEASRSCVLYFICWGYEDGGILDGLTGLVGGILGRGGVAVQDPLVRAAASVAVNKTPKADGVFVTSHETDSFDIFIYKHRSAKVKGKAITVRAIGEVSQDRSDKVRNLSSINGALIQMGPDLK
ncbi:MAG: hypothetical protein ACT4TC_10465 [Myxococcaceae bacterium]